jgi:uncharacterized protein
MMKGIAILAGFVGLLVTSSSVNAQGWCETQAQLNEAERTVCSSDDLRRLDRELNELFRSSNVSTQSERDWIASRNDCGNSERCLFRVYRDRISDLRGRQ